MCLLLGVELETLVGHEALRTGANLSDQDVEGLLEHGQLAAQDRQTRWMRITSTERRSKTMPGLSVEGVAVDT